MVESTLRRGATTAADSAVDALEHELNDYFARLDIWSKELREEFESLTAAGQTELAAMREQLEPAQADKEQLEQSFSAIEAECEEEARATPAEGDSVEARAEARELTAQPEEVRAQAAQSMAEIQAREEELRAQSRRTSGMESERRAEPPQDTVSSELLGDVNELTDAAAESQAAALQAAADAARAEIEAADDELPTGAFPDTREPTPPFTSQSDRDAAPFKFTRALTATTETVEKAVSAREEELPPDLDPETAQKLKLLRRLNSGKSYEELLHRITADKAAQPPSKQKKKHKWFSRK